MNKSKKNNLIAIIASLVAVVMIFGMAMILGGEFSSYISDNGESESFDNIYDSSEDTTVEKTGTVGTAITTVAELKNFFNTNSGTSAYLANDLTISSDWGQGSNYALPANYTLDGNGHTIYYEETYTTAASPAKSQYGVTCWAGTDIYVAGIFLRAISAGATLKNITFVQQNDFICQAGKSADSLGMIGVNNGTMENVNFVMNGKLYYKTDSVNWSEKIVGGLCSINNSGGYIYNCSATINSSIYSNTRADTSYTGYSALSGGVGLNRGTIKGITVKYSSTTPSDGYHIWEQKNGSNGTRHARLGGVVGINDGTVSGVYLPRSPLMSRESTGGGYLSIDVGNNDGTYIYYGSSVSTSDSDYNATAYKVVDSAIDVQWSHTEGGTDCRVKIVPVAAQTYSDRIVWSMDGYSTLYTQATYNPVVDMATGNGASFGSNLTFGFKTSARRTWNVINNETTGTDYNGFQYMGSNNGTYYAVTYNGIAPKLIQTFTVASQGTFYQEINCSQSTVGTATATANRVYEAQKIYDAYVDNATVNVAILERAAKIMLPKFIYDRSGDHAGQYSIDGTTWNSLGSISDATIREFIVKNSTAYLSAPIGEALSGLNPSGTNTSSTQSFDNTWTAINSATELTTFLSGNSGTKGYLNADNISLTISTCGSTYELQSGYTLDGNGKTLTVNLNYASTQWPTTTEMTFGGFLKKNSGTLQNFSAIITGGLHIANNGGSSSDDLWVGSLVGENASGATMQNVTVDFQGKIKAHSYGTSSGVWAMVGGICGHNKGTMQNVKMIMNSSNALGDALQAYVANSTSSYCLIGGIVGENASTGTIYGCTYKYIQGSLYAQEGSSSCTSKASAICANAQSSGTIYGMLIDGDPGIIQATDGSGSQKVYAMTNPSGTWSTTGSYCYLINGATCTERSGIVKIDVGYSDSVTAYNDVNVYFSETTSLRVNIELAKSIVDAGNKILQVGTTNYAAQTVYSVYWEKPTSTFGSLRYGKTLSVDAIKTETESGAQQGIMEGDLEGIVAAMKSYLSLSGGASLTNALIAGYAYDTAALKTQLINANSNYDYTIYTDSTQDKYYVVGNIQLRFSDLYHVYGREVYTWYAYDSSTHPTDYQYAIVANQVSSLSIDESLWLLDGTYYKTKVASYNNQVNAYTPTLSLDLSSDEKYDNISYSGIDDNSIKKLIKFNIYNIVTNTTTTNVYIGKEMNTGNVYDLSVSQLGTASFVSFDKDGYKFTFDASGMLKTGVTYVGFAVAGDPANADPSYLDISDATNIQVKLTRAQMEQYFGSGNSFDLDLIYLYNVTSASESDLKDFLAGTPGTMGGAQKLTLTGNVTITSALSSVVVFNQFKTLEGGGYTITLNSATGADFNGSLSIANPNGYPTAVSTVIGSSNYIYRGGLAAVSLGTINNVNVVLNSDLGLTSTTEKKSYAIGGVVGINQGGTLSNVKVSVASNQTIGAIGQPSVWGTLAAVNSDGSMHDITIGGKKGIVITNNSGSADKYGYLGGVVGIINLTGSTYSMGLFMSNAAGEYEYGYIDIAQPSEFYNIYNMFLGDYVASNGVRGIISGVGYVSGATVNIGTFNNIVFFNKTDSALPFFSLSDAGKHAPGTLSAYGVLGQEDGTAIALDNRLYYGTGITLKYDSYTGNTEVLDMLDYTISGTSIYFNRTDVRNLACADTTRISGTASDSSNAYVTFNNTYFNISSGAATTNQITAVLTMNLAVTTATALNDFLKGAAATDPLMAIINQVDVESNFEINSWDNSTLLKVDQGRTLNGGGNTVTMNLTTINKVYADYSSSDNWSGYKLIYDLMGVNYGTIQNLKFVGQAGNYSSYDLALNHIIGSLVAVNVGTISGVTYSNTGIGTYSNSNTAVINTIAGLVTGVNMGEITSTQLFNRAVFSVTGKFGAGTSVALGAIAGVNDGGYAESVNVLGDNAIELVSTTAGNTNTALYVGGVFGVANNYGTLTFAGNSISKATADKAVISNANVIVAGGMGIRYSGGTIMPYGSRGIFAGIVTGELGYDYQMSGLAFMDMQTNPNLAVSYVYDAGVLSYFASDRIFNNSLTNGELTMMGYYDYGDATPDTSCVSGGKVDILDSHGNSVFMYQYDVTTVNATLFDGLTSYMNGGSTLTFDLQNVSSYLDTSASGIIAQSWSSLGDALAYNGVSNNTILRYFEKVALANFASGTTNNQVGGAKYQYYWYIDPSRDTTNQSNIIQGFIEGKTAQTYRVAGAARVLNLGANVEVTFDGLSAGRVLEADRQIFGNNNTLTVNVGNDTLNINETNAENLYAVEDYEVVGVGGLFAAVLGTLNQLNIVVNITGGTINASNTNLAVGGVAGIICGVTPTFGYVQVNYNGTAIAFEDGGKTLSFGGIFGTMYTKDGGTTTNVTLGQVGVNQVNMVGVTMTGNAQNVAVGGAVGLMQGSVLQGVASPTVLYLTKNSSTASGFDFTSSVGFSGTGGLGGLVGIMASSNLLNINIDQGMSYAGTTPSDYTWDKDMVWTLNGGSGSAVSAMGGAIGVSFGGNINAIGINSRARLINNVGTGAGDATHNYIGGLLGLGSNSGDMSLTGTTDAYTETINGKTYTLTTTKINNIYAGQIGMIAMPDGGYAGYVTGRFINAKEKFGDASNLKNLVWIDFTGKQADLYSKIQVFGATDAAGITLSNVAGMSVLGYVSTDMYNTLTQAGYNKSGSDSDTDKLATYSKITACDFKGNEISVALSGYLTTNGNAATLRIRLIGTMTASGYTPFNTTQDVAGTEYLKSWNYNVYSADGKTAQFSTATYDSGVLDLKQVFNSIGSYTIYESGDRHNYFRIQLFRDEKTIYTEAQLKAFISSSDSGDSNLTGYANASVGVLGNNITLSQEPNQIAFSKTLYGADYTITIKALSNASNATLKAQNSIYYVPGVGTGSSAPYFSTVFDVADNATPIKNSNVPYLYGLFVGHITSAGSIYDTKFEFDQKFYIVSYGDAGNTTGSRPTDENYKAQVISMVCGIVSALNSGTIQNCELTLGANTEFVVNRSMPQSGQDVPAPQNNMCIAGGFTGIMAGATKNDSTNHAYINNCTLNMDDKAIMRSVCEARRTKTGSAYPKAQSMVGGVVGWLGEQAHIFNSTLNGGGLLEATTNTRIKFAYSWEYVYENENYLRANTYASAAGALVGVNTASYYLDGESDQNANDGDKNQPYTNMAPVDDKKVRGEIDGVIINWSGFTMEAILESYRGWQGQVLSSSDPSSQTTGISYGYRQIAGICDWETIANAYLVAYEAEGTSTAYAAWEMDFPTSDEYCYKALAFDAGVKISTRYVGRGGEYTSANPAKEIYLYENKTSDPDDAIELKKLSDTVSLSWELVDASMSLEEIKNATLSFDFTVPTSSGGFLWDVQAYIEKPTNLYESVERDENGIPVTGWQEMVGSNGETYLKNTTVGTTVLFYNDVYYKINSLSDAYKYSEISQTFNRGTNVYLYYSYGTTGSASIDRTQYYYDSTTGVYYHKTTTSFGDSFDMPALKFYAADGSEIPNSTISSTLYRSLQVYNFTGIDPNNPDSETQIVNLTYYDKDDNVIADPSTSDSIASVGLNKPIAGSYRISFDTESEASVTSAIKDISSKTIIFPENDIVSGNFKVVEIITPFGLYAEEMTLITEYSKKGSASNSQIDVQPIVGREEYIAENKAEIQNINWATAGLTYVKTSTDIGVYDIKITLKDWEYYGYLPTANDGNGGLGYNRTYLINGSGFSLEYDFSDGAVNEGITINGSIATLSGRGLVIPTDVEIEYVQKTYDTNYSASSVSSKNSSSITITYSSFYKASSATNKDANAGNGKGVSITGIGRVIYNGNWFDIDRYYSTTSTITMGYGFRATTDDNWNNTKTADVNPTTNHTFSNSISEGSSEELIINGIGTILPKCGTINYIAKEYDGTTTIDYQTAKTSYTELPSDLKPTAEYKTADVVFGGINKYNSIVFDVVAITDMTDSSIVYALSDANYGNNYGIANSGSVSGDKFTLADLGLIVPKTVYVSKALKEYDGDNKFTSSMTFTVLASSDNSAVTLANLGISALSAVGTFDNANVGDGKTITLGSTKQFVYPSGLTTYGDRYFMTQTVANYAATATSYTVGVITPKLLTWKSNIANLAYKTYDGTTTYDYTSASILLDGLISGDTTTKPTITFSGADVNMELGVEISIATTAKTIDGTSYNQVVGYTNYYMTNMTTNTAKGMILPKQVTFSDITKVYDGTTTLSYTTTASVNATTMTTTGAIGGVSLTPKGVYDARHAYTDRTVNWTTTSYTYNTSTYKVLQEAGSATSGTTWAGNYCVSGDSDADITPCTLVAADFLDVLAKQNKSDGTTNQTSASGWTFMYFAGALYVISGSVNKKNNADDVDGEYKLYKAGIAAAINGDGTYDVGTYDVNVTALTGTDAGNYTLAIPFDLGQDLTIEKQTIDSVDVTVMPTNVLYGSDLPIAVTPNGWSATDKISGGAINATFTLNTIKWVDDSSNAVSKTSPIGGYNLSVTAITMTGNDNYQLAINASFTVTVNPGGAKALYILPVETSLGSVEKVYDRTTDFTPATTFKTTADVASPIGNSFVGAYTSKDVQGYNAIAMGNVQIKLITFTYYDETGAQQTKYVIATGNATTMSNYYLAVTPAADGYATLQVGVITPKEVSVSGTVSITQSDSKGVALSQTNDAPGNFEYYSSATYSYGATLTGVISGDTVSVSITDSCGGVYDAGTYDLSVNGLTGADSGNYYVDLMGISAQLTIVAQTLAKVSVTIKPINVVYGAAIPATLDGAAASATDKISGDGVTAGFAVSGFSTTATSTSPIGGYDITIDYGKVSLTGNDNYVVGATTIVEVSVTPAEAKALYIIPAEATINSITKTYDGTTAFMGAIFDVSVGGITINGAYVGKNAGINKSVTVNVAAFEYYNTNGTQVSVNIFVGSNYKLSNAHTATAGVATVDGVGVINPYTITSSDITGIVFAQSWLGSTSKGDSFEYGYSAVYAIDSYVIKKLADDDSYSLSFVIYKQGGVSPVTTGLDVGTYIVKITGISNQSPADNYTVSEIVVSGATMTITPQIIDDANVYATADHAWVTYDGAAHGYPLEDVAVYVTDKDGREVVVSGAASNPKVSGAASQTTVGNYNVTVDINISGTDRNYSFNAVSDKTLNVSKGGVATEFAIIPMQATLNAAYKEYDGTTSISGATLNITGADGKAITIPDGATLSAYFKSADVNVSGGFINMVFSVATFSYYADGKATTKTTVYRMQTSTTTGEGEEATTLTETSNYYIGNSILNGSTAEVSGIAYITPKKVTITAADKVYDGTADLVGSVSTSGTIGGASISVKGKFYNESSVEDGNAGSKKIIFEIYENFVLGGTTYLVLKDGASKVSGTDCASNYYIEANNLPGEITQREFVATDLQLLNIIQAFVASGDANATIEIYPTANSSEYSSAYNYLRAAIGGEITMDGATVVSIVDNWTLTLFKAFAEEPNLTLTVKLIKNGVEVNAAQDAGTYTVTIELSGDNYYTSSPVSKTFVIDKQIVDSAENILVYMDGFDGEYGTSNFDNPSASTQVYQIGIKDKVSGQIVTFAKGDAGHTFAIASLAFCKTPDGTPQAPISPDAYGVYIGAYYLFAASVTGYSDNFDTTGLILDGKKIYAIGASTLDDNTHSKYYITPALLNVTSVTKVYDGTTDTTTATFVYNGGKTQALSAVYDSHNSTHSADGKTAVSGADRIVNFKTSTMSVATTLGNTDYAIALLADGTTYTNYYIEGMADANGYIAIDGVAVITKFKITDGIMTLDVTGYVKDVKEAQTVSIDKNTTVTFVYADGYTYDGGKFAVTALKPTSDSELFNAGDNVADMTIFISGTIKNAGTYTVILDRLEAANYEMTGATLGTIVIEKQIVTEDRVVINIPYLVNIYNGTVQKPESSDQFSFVVKDFYTDRDVKSNASGGGGLSAFKYYEGDYIDGATTVEPKNIGRYSVSVVVDTSFIDADNYTFDGSVTEITKFAQDGKAVYFILPKAVTATGVYKQYDGYTAFGTPIFVNAEDNTGAKTIITVKASDIISGEETNVYEKIAAAGGKFTDKNIKVQDGNLVGGDVQFAVKTFQYYDADGISRTAYYIDGTNHTIEGTGSGAYVTVSGIGVITPVAVGYNSLTKTYDGTNFITYVASVDYNKTTESVSGRLATDAIVGATGYYYSTDAGVGEVGTGIDVYLQYQIVTYQDIEYYTLVNDPYTTTSNACNYYVFSIDADSNITYPTATNHPTDAGNGYVKIAGIGTIKAVSINIGGSTGTENATIYNMQFMAKSGTYYAYNNTTAFEYFRSYAYDVSKFKATIGFNENKKQSELTYDSGSAMVLAEGINGDVLYFSIYFDSEGTTSVSNAKSYTLYIKLVKVMNGSTDVTSKGNYDFASGSAQGSFKINQQVLDESNITLRMSSAVSTTYNGKAGNLTVDKIVGINSSVAIDKEGYSVTLSGTITATDFQYVGEAPVNVGGYALKLKVSGLTSSDSNYAISTTAFMPVTLTDSSSAVYKIEPKEIKLPAAATKSFDGTINFVVDTGVEGEKIVVGSDGAKGLGSNALAGIHTFAIGDLAIVSVSIDAESIANADTNGFNKTLIKEDGTIDFATAIANYTIAADSDVSVTINPSNIVVAERHYDYDSDTAEIEVAITGLAGTQFLNNTVDDTNLSGILKVSVNSFASFEIATTAEIGAITTTPNTDELGYVSYVITFKYIAKGTLDSETYTDRYVFAVAGASDGYSTNMALTSSELADGQMDGAAISIGTAVSTADELANALGANQDIYLTSNIYGWDASAYSQIDYTGTLYGNGYSIQLAGGLNGDENYGGAFIASLGGTIQDVNFKFTSTQTLGATTVGMVVGNMTGSMSNVSLDIINTPTIDGATAIGGLAGAASGAALTNATVIFNASVDNTSFGGMVGNAANATFNNVSVRAYNGNSTTGKTIANNASGCTFDGVIDLIGSDTGATAITNLYTVNTMATGAKANGVLELLTPHTEGFVEYYFTTLAKTGNKTHNVYNNGADERDKTMYQTYGTVSGTVLAIETLAPRNRFIWEAYSHSYQTEVAGGGHINLSLNRYVAMMPVGTVIEEDGYTLEGESKTDMTFITVDVTMFRPAIGIRGSQEIAASGSIVKEVEYTGGQISHEVSITVDGKVTSVSVSGVEAGYYDNIVVELSGDVTTDDINYDTINRTAVVAKIDDGATVAGAILIIYPKQTALPDSFTKTYDTTSIGEFTTTVGGSNATLLGTYVDGSGVPASDVGTNLVSFANTLNPTRNVLVDADGNYIAQHHKTESDGKITYSYTKISVTTNGGVDGNFTTSTDFTTLTKNSLMRALAQLIDYDTAVANDATGTASYVGAWVYNVTAIKAADAADGYFDELEGFYIVPMTIGDNAGDYTFTSTDLAVGSLSNIYIGTSLESFAVLAGTTSSKASITPAQREATYTIANADKLSFRTTHTKGIVSVAVKTWDLSAYEQKTALPTTMTAEQKESFSNFMSAISAANVDTLNLMAATSGSKIIDNKDDTYSVAYTASDKYLAFKLPATITKDTSSSAEYGNYVIVPDSKVIEFRYFIANANGEFELSSYKDVLTLGERVVVEVDGVEYESNYHTYDYILTDNINMKSALITPFDWNNGTAFAGSVDGAGYALTNYIVKGENNVGLFASMTDTASVTNLIMGNVMVVATAVSADVNASALTTSAAGTITNVATEMRVVTATTGAVNVTNVGESFVRVHKQSGSDVAISTKLNGVELAQDTYLTPTDIDALSKFGGAANFLDKFVLNNAKLTYNYNSTAGTLSINVNNFREYWGWYNICPWLEGGNTWKGIRPTKVNTVTEAAAA